MPLTCECNYDFDSGCCEAWWEKGRDSIPPEGACCCECGAKIPNDGEVATICHMETYEPEGVCPDFPDGDDPDLSDIAYDRAVEAHEAFRDANGWNDENDRYERVAFFDYRCDRCAGIAEAIENLGYCLIPPGEVPEQHCDYVYEHSGVEMVWVKDTEGVLNPKRQ